MALTEIELLLRQTIGLDAASVGLPLIERAVQQRQAACGLKDMTAYLARLRSSASELQELIEAVVVSETWFFRDPEAFAALGQYVLQEWLPGRTAGQFRVLSIPCATGEEAYTLAMTLDGIGLPADCFQIEAIDISEQALARARKAVYGRNSFRGRNLDFRDRYFEAGAHGYHVAHAIRRQVVFQQANLLGPDFLPGSPIFHAIFCRNLLIYLDPPAQARAIETLKRLLAPDGLFFVGPAEAALMLNHDLVSARRPLAFAFRKAPPKPAAHKKPLQVKKKIAPPHIPVPLGKMRAPLKTQRISLTRRLTLSGKTGADLKLAERMANEGRLAEAIQICESHLKEHPSSVEALYLLGVICDAAGDRDKAGSYYRKTLYLSPDHYESLLHLAYSAEKSGDAPTAQNLRARAHRVKERRQHA